MKFLVLPDKLRDLLVYIWEEYVTANVMGDWLIEAFDKLAFYIFAVMIGFPILIFLLIVAFILRKRGKYYD